MFPESSIQRRAMHLLDVMQHAESGTITLPADDLSRVRPHSAIAYEHGLTMMAASSLVLSGHAQRIRGDVPTFRLIPARGQAG